MQYPLCAVSRSGYYTYAERLGQHAHDVDLTDMIRDLFDNSIAAYKTGTNKTADPAYEKILPLNMTFRKMGPIHKFWICTSFVSMV